MQLFDEIFNRATIYDILFFNVKAVLTYPNLKELYDNNPTLYKRWQYVSKSKFNLDIPDAYDTVIFASDDIYTENAVYYPEFTKIATITYASLKSENGKLKRSFKKIENEDEYLLIATYMDVLHQLSSEGINSTPKYFRILCGHNIINYDIPLLIKRFILHREKFEHNKQLPFILKNALNTKPWEATIIDTVNVWKFNSNNYTPLMLIADYLNLKKTVDLDKLSDVSRKYWKYYNDNPQDAFNYISLQSATQTNLVIQLINELRLL